MPFELIYPVVIHPESGRVRLLNVRVAVTISYRTINTVIAIYAE